MLADMTGSEAIPVVRLTEVFRQTARSRVIVNVHRINRGQMPELGHTGPPSDFCFVDAAKPEDGLQKLLTINIGTGSRKRSTSIRHATFRCCAQ